MDWLLTCISFLLPHNVIHQKRYFLLFEPTCCWTFLWESSDSSCALDSGIQILAWLAIWKRVTEVNKWYFYDLFFLFIFTMLQTLHTSVSCLHFFLLSFLKLRGSQITHEVARYLRLCSYFFFRLNSLICYLWIENTNRKNRLFLCLLFFCIVLRAIISALRMHFFNLLTDQFASCVIDLSIDCFLCWKFFLFDLSIANFLLVIFPSCYFRVISFLLLLHLDVATHEKLQKIVRLLLALLLKRSWGCVLLKMCEVGTFL